MTTAPDTPEIDAPAADIPATSTPTDPASPVGEPDVARAGSTPEHPLTLAVDVGGTGIKASVLDAAGRLVADRVRVPTIYPLPPEKFLETVATLVRPLPSVERVSVGFPGVVRAGTIITAPHFVTAKGPGSKIEKSLLAAWSGFAIENELSARLGHPTRVANDADLQGLAVIAGRGIEFVITLGTGVGTALFSNGKLAPHLEFAHHPFRNNETYNEQIGEAALEAIGRKRWRRRAVLAIETFRNLVNFDCCYIGGGNARLLKGHIEDSVKLVDNVAGILGGIKLWEDEGELRS